MKINTIILLAVFLLFFGCHIQNNEGYLEVVNLSSDIIKIHDFGKGEESIVVGDTSTMYSFELGDYEYSWHRIYVSGKYINEIGGRYPNEYLDYYQDVCIYNGKKTILEISDYLDECSVNIINSTTHSITYLSAERAELLSFLDPGESERWDFRAPIDSGMYFSIQVQEPFRFDTLFMVFGGEHLSIDILSH